MSKPSGFIIGTAKGGRPFTLPLDAVVQTLGIIARKGAGKTWFGLALAELMLDAGQMLVVIDPIGVWWGLRAAGKRPGFPVLIMGGEHADVPLDPKGGRYAAEFVVSERVPTIFDLSLMGENEMRRFVADFLAALYQRNRQALHLFLDEADEWAPQSNFGPEHARVLSAAQNVVRRGRARGLGVTLITQRPAAIHKGVLTQTECLVMGQVTGPHDQKALESWIQYHGTAKEREIIMTSLPTLQRGQMWVYSPGWLQTLERIQVRDRWTFDSSKTPAPGEAPQRPKTVAEVDVGKLSERMRVTIDQAKSNDPAELRRRIAGLEQQLKQAANGQAKPDPAAIANAVNQAMAANDRRWLAHLNTLAVQFRRVKATIDQGEAALEKADELWAKADALWAQPPAEARFVPMAAATSIPAPARAARASTPAPSGDAGDIKLGKAERAILAAIIQRRPATTNKSQASILSGYSIKSSSFANALSALRSAGLIDGASESMQPTAAGLEALPDCPPLPAGEALFNYWCGRLQKSEAALLTVAYRHYPQAVDKSALSSESGYSITSSSFANALSKLRTLELVKGYDQVRAADALFGG